MNKIINITVSVILFLSCKTEPSLKVELSNEDWNKLLNEVPSWNNESNKILNEFRNNANKDIIKTAYKLYSENLEYPVLESTINYIEKRNDENINFTKIDNYTIISDSSDLRYITLSEPFYVDKNKFLFSILFWHEEEKRRNFYIYFCKKEQNDFVVFSYFDFNERSLFNLTPH